MRNKVQAAAKKYKKAVKGEITLGRAVEYAKSLGYYVIFYSSVNDEYLIRYNLSEYAQETTAFTYNELACVIFINNNISYSEKLHRLLHEIGHIELKHIGSGEQYLKNHDEAESEAEAFVYSVLYKKEDSSYVLLVSILSILAFICFAIKLNIGGIKSSLPKELQADDVVSASDTVYVTPSGTKFHKADCIYIKDKEYIKLNRADAEKKYAPCSICNP